MGGVLVEVWSGLNCGRGFGRGMVWFGLLAWFLVEVWSGLDYGRGFGRGMVWI